MADRKHVLEEAGDPPFNRPLHDNQWGRLVPHKYNPDGSCAWCGELKSRNECVAYEPLCEKPPPHEVLAVHERIRNARRVANNWKHARGGLGRL